MGREGLGKVAVFSRVWGLGLCMFVKLTDATGGKACAGRAEHTAGAPGRRVLAPAQAAASSWRLPAPGPAAEERGVRPCVRGECHPQEE